MIVFVNPITAACLWIIIAWVLSLVLKPKATWPAAYGLIAIGVPLLVWLYLEEGFLAALIGFTTGCLVLRWPVRYFGRWLKAWVLRSQ